MNQLLPAQGCGEECIAQRSNALLRTRPCVGETAATCEQTLAGPCTAADLEVAPAAATASVSLPLRGGAAAAAAAVFVALLAL